MNDENTRNSLLKFCFDDSTRRRRIKVWLHIKGNRNTVWPITFVVCLGEKKCDRRGGTLTINSSDIKVNVIRDLTGDLLIHVTYS